MHAARPPPRRPRPRRRRGLVAGRITGELRDLADTVERVSQHFAWSAPTVDRGLTDAPGTVANGCDTLANLAVSLDTIGRRTTWLAEKIRAIDLEPDTHSRTGPYLDVCQHPQTRPCRLVCETPDGTAPRTRNGATRRPCDRAWGELARRADGWNLSRSTGSDGVSSGEAQ
jgi:hypothetical protein